MCGVGGSDSFRVLPRDKAASSQGPGKAWGWSLEPGPENVNPQGSTSLSHGPQGAAGLGDSWLTPKNNDTFGLNT